MTDASCTVQSADHACGLAGRKFGPSDWLRVTQALIDDYARVSGDTQWLHVDPERAAQGPYGKCVAHGLLSLSLAGGHFFHQLLRLPEHCSGINYGCERVRYPAPLRVDEQVRAWAEVQETRRLDANGVQLTVRITLETQDQAKPVCVADFVVRYYF